MIKQAKSLKYDGIELDYENGKMIYEVSFDALCSEYEYDIDAVTGSIIKKDIERDDDCKINKNKLTSDNSKNLDNNYIGTSKAKSVALNNANISESSTRDLEVEFDYENGRAIYEVGFKYKNKEYEYEIDAKTGRILYKNIEADD